MSTTSIICIAIILMLIIVYSKNEQFYTSGASLRSKAAVDKTTEQNIDEADFNKRVLQYYLHRPTY